MYLGVGLCAWGAYPFGASLNQACVEDFIRDLVEVVPVRLEMTKE